MIDDYEEIYDQAGFFASIWDQLPKEFTENESNESPWKDGVCKTSHSMIIWDCSEEWDEKNRIEIIPKEKE